MAVVKDNATVPNSRTTEETLPMAVVRDNESEADNVNGLRVEAINLVEHDTGGKMDGGREKELPSALN